MRFDRIIGWGVVVYAIMFLLWSGFVQYGFLEGVTPHIIAMAVLIGTLTLITRVLRPPSVEVILPYAVGWVLVSVFLDVVFSLPYAGWELFADWSVLIGYALIFIVPIVVVSHRTKAHTSGN
jgi:hypothetical protein